MSLKVCRFPCAMAWTDGSTKIAHRWRCNSTHSAGEGERDPIFSLSRISNAKLYASGHPKHLPHVLTMVAHAGFASSRSRFRWKWQSEDGRVVCPGCPFHSHPRLPQPRLFSCILLPCLLIFPPRRPVARKHGSAPTALSRENVIA